MQCFVDRCLFFCTFSFVHCDLRFTDSDYPFGIFNVYQHLLWEWIYHGNTILTLLNYILTFNVVTITRGLKFETSGYAIVSSVTSLQMYEKQHCRGRFLCIFFYVVFWGQLLFSLTFVIWQYIVCSSSVYRFWLPLWYFKLFTQVTL